LVNSHSDGEIVRRSCFYARGIGLPRQINDQLTRENIFDGFKSASSKRRRRVRESWCRSDQGGILPGVVLLGGWKFRAEIRKLLTGLSSLKFAGFEAIFVESLAATQRKIAA
jgi:hypothetical protein